jgi:peptidoglycan/xylan/chitin deacetylase (PgdA/CDA1 family)
MIIVSSWDDGDGNADTKVVHAYRRANATCTFFPIGRTVEPNPDALRLFDGFEVGNHTFNHVNLTKCSEEEIIDEVKRSNDIIEERTGIPVAGLAYPFGGGSYREAEIMKKLGFLYCRKENSKNYYSQWLLPVHTVYSSFHFWDIYKSCQGCFIFFGHEHEVSSRQELEDRLNRFKDNGDTFMTLRDFVKRFYGKESLL